MPHICTSRLPPLPPRRYMYIVKCRNNLMWKKPVCTVLGISSSGWGFERTLVEASIYEAHCSFLRVLHQPLVLALLGVAPPPVVFSEQTSINIISWMWRRPFLGHPIRDRCRTYAATDAGSPPRATSLPSFGNLEPVRKEQWVHKKKAISIGALLPYSLLQSLASLTLRAWMLPPVFNERRICLAISSGRSEEALSAIGLALFIWLAGSISTRTKTAQQAIYRDPRLGSRASTSTSASFWPKSNAIRRVRSRPRNAPFFHGN